MGLATICVGAVCILVLYFISNALRPGLVSIPGPFLAKFSNLYRLMLVHKGQFSHDVLKLHRKYGPLVRLGPDTVSIADSRLVEPIYGLKTNFPKSDWIKSSQTLVNGKVVPALLTTQDKDVHSSLKRPIASAYSVTTLMGYEPWVNDTIAVFLKRLDELFIQTEAPCDLHNWLQYYAYDVIGVITMSDSMGFLEQGKDIDGMLEEIKVEATYRALTAQMPSLDYWLRKNPIMTRVARPTHGIMVRAKQILSNRLASAKPDDENRRDFISRFLEAKEKNPDTLTNRNMLGFVGSNLQAGSDTTAIVLRTIFYYTMKDKAILARLRREIDELDTQECPIPFQVAFSSMPYLDAVIKEALRIHPPFALLLERFVPPQGLELPDGGKLPGGSIVGMFGYTMHRDKEIFGEDVDSFNPTRWLQQDGEPDEDFKSRVRTMQSMDMAFGHGTRSCLGKHIAELQIYKLVPVLVRLLDIELVDPEKEWTVKEIFFAIQSDMDVKVKWRKGMSMESFKVTSN